MPETFGGCQAQAANALDSIDNGILIGLVSSPIFSFRNIQNSPCRYSVLILASVMFFKCFFGMPHSLSGFIISIAVT